MLKKLIIFLLMALVTSVNAESNETEEEESKISTIGGILQIKKDEVGLKSFFLTGRNCLMTPIRLPLFPIKKLSTMRITCCFMDGAEEIKIPESTIY